MILFDKVAILGAGLLGSSLAFAMKEKSLCKRVNVWSRSIATRNKCKKKAWCDKVFDRVEGAVKDADLVVLSSTPSSICEVAKVASKAVKRGALVVDLASVKANISKECAKIFRKTGAKFVASHPMAGSDKSGVDAANKDLFKGASVFICADESSASAKKIAKLWKSLNMKVEFISAKKHDEIAAKISHVPQAVATSLAMFAAKNNKANIFKKFAGNGFRDTTRIAKSDASMWVDIFLQNSKNVAQGLGEFIEQAQNLKSAILAKDAEKIRAIMQAAKDARLNMEK